MFHWRFILSFPNIWGATGATISGSGVAPNGAFGEEKSLYNIYDFGSGSDYFAQPFLNATLVSTIYKSGYHSVQPESYRVLYIIKY